MDPKKVDEFIERNNAKIKIANEVIKRISWGMGVLILALLLTPFEKYISDIPVYVLFCVALVIFICTWLYERREKRKIT